MDTTGPENVAGGDAAAEARELNIRAAERARLDPFFPKWLKDARPIRLLTYGFRGVGIQFSFNFKCLI